MKVAARGPRSALALVILALSLGGCGGSEGGTGAERAAAPVFTPAGGSFTGSVEVALSTTTDGAAIRYTTDGSSPGVSAGNRYTGPFTLDRVGRPITVKAIAYADGMDPSAVATRTFTLSAEGQAAAPEFDPTPGGTFDAAQTVVLSTDTAGADIYYELTSNGTVPPNPTTASHQYIGPITLARTAPPGGSKQYRIKAISVMASMANSPIASATYTITTPAGAAPALRVAGTTFANEWGETSLSIQFDMARTDFRTEDYTASFDLYVPSTSTAPTAIQTQYPDDSAWKAMYFNA